MSKKTKTALTFMLKVELPLNSNASVMQLFIRESIVKNIPKDPNDPLKNLLPESFTVALLKKETTYG